MSAIDYFNSASPFRGVATRVSLRARRRMYQRFLALAGDAAGRRILDLGTTPDTSLADSNYLEQWYPHRQDITMASIEDCSALEQRFPGATFARIEQNRPLPFADGHFDVGFSSAVLEHVGGTAAQLFYLTELLRTCRSVFLTTPDRAFPVEMHTFLPVLHWLPKPVHRRALTMLGKDFWASEANLNLLTRSELSRLVVAALRATARPPVWSIARHGLWGWPSNLILWIPSSAGKPHLIMSEFASGVSRPGLPSAVLPRIASRRGSATS